MREHQQWAVGSGRVVPLCVSVSLFIQMTTFLLYLPHNYLNFGNCLPSPCRRRWPWIRTRWGRLAGHNLGSQLLAQYSTALYICSPHRQQWTWIRTRWGRPRISSKPTGCRCFAEVAVVAGRCLAAADWGCLTDQMVGLMGVGGSRLDPEKAAAKARGGYTAGAATLAAAELAPPPQLPSLTAASSVLPSSRWTRR